MPATSSLTPTYLRHVLTELPQRESDADISDLLPFNFARSQSRGSTT